MRAIPSRGPLVRWLLLCVFVCVCVCVCVYVCVCMLTQLCLTLWDDPMGCSLPGSFIHGTFQARMLEWVTLSFSRGSSQPRHQTHVSSVSCIGRQILYHCTTWEAIPFSSAKALLSWDLVDTSSCQDSRDWESMDQACQKDTEDFEGAWLASGHRSWQESSECRTPGQATRAIVSSVSQGHLSSPRLSSAIPWNCNNPQETI